MATTLRMLVLVWEEYGTPRAYVLDWQGDQQDRGPGMLSIHDWASDEIDGVGRLGESVEGLDYPEEPGIHLFEGSIRWRATPSLDEPHDGHTKFEGTWTQVSLPELPVINPLTEEQILQRHSSQITELT